MSEFFVTKTNNAPKRLTIFTIICTLAMVCVISIIRKPSNIILPQFWAEDGCVFFAQARVLGWMSLLQPHTTYFVLYQRAIAYLATFFPVSWSPAIYGYCSLFAVIGVATYCLLSRIPNQWKVPFALAITLVPNCWEIWLNLTNAQWTIAILLLILIIQDPPTHYLQEVIDFILLLLAGLTGPYIIFFSPLFFARFFTQKHCFRYNVFLCLLMTVILAIHYHRIQSVPHPSLTGGWNRNLHYYINEFGYDLPVGLFFGRIGDYLPRIGLVFAIPYIVIGMLGIAFLQKGRKTFLFLFLAAISIFAAALIKATSLGDEWELRGTRYSYLPYLCLIWCFIILCYDTNPWLRKLGAVSLFFVVLSTVSTFRMAPLPDLHWKDYAKIIEAGEATRVPINPGGNWGIYIPAAAAQK